MTRTCRTPTPLHGRRPPPRLDLRSDCQSTADSADKAIAAVSLCRPDQLDCTPSLVLFLFLFFFSPSSSSFRSFAPFLFFEDKLWESYPREDQIRILQLRPATMAKLLLRAALVVAAAAAAMAHAVKQHIVLGADRNPVTGEALPIRCVLRGRAAGQAL